VLRPAEVEKNYEANTGAVIIERFEALDAMEMPAVLVAGHAPFTWGRTVKESLANAIALEAVAAMALDTIRLGGDDAELEEHVLNKHYRRKHGKDAYYGQD
jgi:L-ribulose-5-phosphate 4-epimerase